MSKKIFMVLIAILITAFLVVPSIAKNSKSEAVAKTQKKETVEKGPSTQAGNSNIGHLYLYEKAPDPELTRDDPWLIVEGGMWGKMKYNLSGPTFDFVFNAHGLPIGQSYTLIYYPDPWPGTGLICLGDSIVGACEDEEGCIEDGTGNIHIAGSVDTGNLPIEADTNDGAKIFLVPSIDVDCENQKMVGWTGDDANLYEGALITFDDTDGITDMRLEAAGKGPSTQAGNSNIGHLYLYEKDSSVTNEAGDWSIVEGGMWGKMKYNLSGPTFDFVFNGHGLPIGQEYALIYYPDPWPGVGLILLGSGVVAECEEECIEGNGGNIHIKGSVDTGDLPIDGDENDGAKIFLVPLDHLDLENDMMIGWTEDANLYEGALITFDDTDGE